MQLTPLAVPESRRCTSRLGRDPEGIDRPHPALLRLLGTVIADYCIGVPMSDAPPRSRRGYRPAPQGVAGRDLVVAIGPGADHAQLSRGRGSRVLDPLRSGRHRSGEESSHCGQEAMREGDPPNSREHGEAGRRTKSGQFCKRFAHGWWSSEGREGYLIDLAETSGRSAEI